MSERDNQEIYYADLKSDPAWFLMELADCTLKDEMEKDRTLAARPHKALFDILAGLEALHERGIIHRDLKPANVLRFGGDDEQRYAISDFGLMSATSSESSSLTLSNMGGGTPFYAAPECVRNLKRSTILSDIYSFGAILFDIFGSGASRVPYTELSVPGPIGPIVERCTKRLPHKRYSSIAELRAELYDALHDELLSFTSNEDKAAIALLEKSNQLSSEDWERIFVRMDDNEQDGRLNSDIIRYINREHIMDVFEKDITIFSAFGRQFSAYVQQTSFNFDYCDVLADKCQVFYDLGDAHIKAKIALSLLVMGVNHNRWFVERKFVAMAGVTVPDTVAVAILIEANAQGLDFDRLIQRLERSINVARGDLHPNLQSALEHAAI